jgi:MHS family proline/betaine transporter-like MFS transporter
MGSSTAYIVEWAPPDSAAGTAASSRPASWRAAARLGHRGAVHTILTPEQMDAWGWRVPFLLGGILGPVGLWMRRTIDETPAYNERARHPCGHTEPRSTG